MPNNRQFKLQTRFLATRNVHEYRASIAEWVEADDTVLEIGCEWGTTTRLLAPACRRVIGTDISEDCIARARRQYPKLEFDVFDAFDVRAALDLAATRGVERFTKIYIDMSGLSGYRSLLDTISLLQMYATLLRPDAIVVKSASLKHFAAHCEPWRAPARTEADDAGPSTRRERDGSRTDTI